MNEKRLGLVVQRARRAAGYTQQTLCQKSGLSYSTLAKIERGAIKSPSVFTIQLIANQLGMSLDALMADVPPAVSNRGKKVSKTGVKFIYFDMNGCLVRSSNRAFTTLATESGTTIDIIESVFWKYNDDICRGEMTLEALNEALSERLGMTVDWAQYYLDAVEPTPGMAGLVRWASENYRVGILTNTAPGLVKPMIERGILPDITFDVIVDSSQVGAIKPEPRMFEIAAELAAVDPGALLLVDDDRSNLTAAGKHGWHTMSFDPFHPEESIVSVSTALEPAS